MDGGRWSSGRWSCATACVITQLPPGPFGQGPQERRRRRRDCAPPPPLARPPRGERRQLGLKSTRSGSLSTAPRHLRPSEEAPAPLGGAGGPPALRGPEHRSRRVPPTGRRRPPSVEGTLGGGVFVPRRSRAHADGGGPEGGRCSASRTTTGRDRPPSAAASGASLPAVLARRALRLTAAIRL